MAITFNDAYIHSFPYVRSTQWTVTFEMHRSIFCFNFYNVWGLLLCSFSFKTPRDRNFVLINPGIEGSQVLRNNVTTKEVTELLHWWICCMHHSSILLKLAIFFIDLQKGSEILNEFLVMFSFYRFTE
jgi:hypothetical protein